MAGTEACLRLVLGHLSHTFDPPSSGLVAHPPATAAPLAVMSTRISRLLVLQRALAARSSARVSDLQEELGVSRRTIYRDLQTLRRAGVDIRFDRKQKGHTSPAEEDFLPPDPESLLALLRHAAATSLPATPSQRRRVAMVAEALAGQLPDELHERYEQFLQRVVVSAQEDDYDRYAAVLETVERAGRLGRCVEVLACLPVGADLGWHAAQVLRLRFDLGRGWLLEGLLAESHRTCRIAFAAIESIRVAETLAAPRLVRGKVEWTVADIEVGP